MSDFRKCQRSRRMVQDTIDAQKQQLKFAIYLNDQEQVKNLSEQLGKLEKALQLIDHSLAKLQANAHFEAA